MGQDFKSGIRNKGKQRATTIYEDEEGPEPKSALTVFLKLTEEKSMVRLRPYQLETVDADDQREGRKTASDRRAQLKAISQSVRHSISQGEKERNKREDEEMARLLQGMVMQQEKKEKELAEQFAEREKKLWAVSTRRTR